MRVCGEISEKSESDSVRLCPTLSDSVRLCPTTQQVPIQIQKSQKWIQNPENQARIDLVDRTAVAPASYTQESYDSPWNRI